MSETIPEFCIDRTSQLKESTLFCRESRKQRGAGRKCGACECGKVTRMRSP